jgi:ubiquinone/menaquinone biosynthesis C-methylase UbiE
VGDGLIRWRPMSHEDYVLPSSEGESLRLEQQARLYGGLDFLKPFLREHPHKVLEVGCGTGIFTRHVADALGSSEVTGLDMDASRLAFAREHNGAPNVRYEQGDLLALPFDSNGFDLVFCRFVLVHVQDPTQALSEMKRVTRPGGRVVAYDMVHDGIWFSPDKPAFAKVLRAAIQVMRDRGMEPSQGLQLASGMIRAGLQQVRAQVIAHQALAPDPVLEAYRANWVDTVTGLSEILGASFEAGLIEQAREELLRSTADEFLVELTVVADGTKRDG